MIVVVGLSIYALKVWKWFPPFIMIMLALTLLVVLVTLVSGGGRQHL
jgi:hypothetical protein